MLNNFLSFGENNFFPVDRYKGFTVVNSDPANQGGKTTLTIDAIKYLFFGTTTKTDKNEQIFNQYSSNNELTNLDITHKICEIFDDLYNTKNSKNLIKFVKDRKGHDFRYAIDNSQIFRELKWKPSIDFETGLKDTIKFYYKNFKNLKKIYTYG